MTSPVEYAGIPRRRYTWTTITPAAQLGGLVELASGGAYAVDVIWLSEPFRMIRNCFKTP